MCDRDGRRLATGTSAGPLAGYVERFGYAKVDNNYTVLQGVAVQHPSLIDVKITCDGIWAGGTSVVFMEGSILI